MLRVSAPWADKHKSLAQSFCLVSQDCHTPRWQRAQSWGIEHTDQHKLPQDPNCFHNGQSMSIWCMALDLVGSWLCIRLTLRDNKHTHRESKTDVGRIEESMDRGQAPPSSPTLLNIFWNICHVLTTLKAKTETYSNMGRDHEMMLLDHGWIRGNRCDQVDASRCLSGPSLQPYGSILPMTPHSGGKEWDWKLSGPDSSNQT